MRQPGKGNERQPERLEQERKPQIERKKRKQKLSADELQSARTWTTKREAIFPGKAI